MMISNVDGSDSLRIRLGLPFYFAASLIRHTDATLGQIVRAIRNWWDAVFIFLGVSAKAKLYFRNGVEFEASKDDLGKVVSLAEFNNLSQDAKRRLRVKINGDLAVMYIRGRRLDLDLEVANPVAIEVSTKEHSMIDVKGRDVVDIGAYVNDTAIYYAVYCRAKHVYAFEPFPYLYRTGVKNVKANKLDSIISTYNLGVAGKAGAVSLNEAFTSFNMVNAKGHGKGVKFVSLDDIVDRLKINHGALKVDCEGCEYELFKRASSKTLRSFELMHIEYHYGYKDIVERLRKEGYEVSYTKPIYNFRGFGSKPMLNGHIVAERKGGAS